MDLGLIGIVVALGGLVVGYLFGTYKSNKQIVDAVQERDDALDKLRKADKKAQKKSAPKEAPASSNSKELKEAKSEIKTLKKQIYDLKQSKKETDKKSETPKKKSKKEKSKDADIIFDLREEVGDLKVKLAEAEEKLKAVPAPAKHVDVEAPQVNASDSEEVKELKAKQSEQLKALKEKQIAAEKELKQKLKKASSNADQQRRRADNNDKAFKIAQRQVDGLQERIAQLERELGGAPTPKLTVSSAAAVPVSNSEPVPEEPADPKPATEAPAAVASAPVEETPAPAAEAASAPAEETPEPAAEAAPEPAQSQLDLGDVPNDEAPVPGFVMTKEAEPNTVEISEEMADDILAEEEQLADPARSTALLHSRDIASLANDVPKTLGDEASSVDDAWAEFDVD